MLAKKQWKPVVVETRSRKIVSSWWANAWIQNLERYADFSNRLPRGRTYVRKGAVVHLEIHKGKIISYVQGSRRKPYEVEIEILPLNEKKKKKIQDVLQDNVSSMEDLLHGEFPESLKEELLDTSYGLFPLEREFLVGCSCPDWAYMCKHVIATLYAVALRLDEEPLLFFELRGMDPKTLIQKGVQEKIQELVQNRTMSDNARIIKDEKVIEDLFQI